MADLDHLAEQISRLTVLEAIQLAKNLLDRAGVTSADHPRDAGPIFGVTLTSFGYNKIQVIKAVREMTGMGLADAKRLVEGAPQIVKKDMTEAEAEQVRRLLIEAGASADIVRGA